MGLKKFAQMSREIGRSIFQNHIIRFQRSTSNVEKPVEVFIDMWPLENNFVDVDTARTFAVDYVRRMHA